jgi:hypothetical protein
LWREGIATILTFCGDTLFQQNPVSWYQTLIAMGKFFVAGRYCDNMKFSWRYSISTKFSVVALHTYCSGQNICNKKVLPQFEVFVVILYFNKVFPYGAK